MGYNPSRTLLMFRFLKPLTVRSYGGLNNGKNIIIIIIIIIAMGKVVFFNTNRYNFTDFLTPIKS